MRIPVVQCTQPSAVTFVFSPQDVQHSMACQINQGKPPQMRQRSVQSLNRVRTFHEICSSRSIRNTNLAYAFSCRVVLNLASVALRIKEISCAKFSYARANDVFKATSWWDASETLSA